MGDTFKETSVNKIDVEKFGNNHKSIFGHTSLRCEVCYRQECECEKTDSSIEIPNGVTLDWSKVKPEEGLFPLEEEVKVVLGPDIQNDKKYIGEFEAHWNSIPWGPFYSPRNMDSYGKGAMKEGFVAACKKRQLAVDVADILIGTFDWESYLSTEEILKVEAYLASKK